MLRLLVLLLLLLNVGYFAWGQGWLLAYGWGPMQQSEPQHLAQQVHPEALVLLSSGQAADMPPKPATAKSDLDVTNCLISDNMDAAQADLLRPILGTLLPTASWTFDASAAPARWMIYMGKYALPADLAKKRAELATLNLKPAILNDSPLAPGLSLGTYGSKASADAALQALLEREVRSAKVLPMPAAPQRYRLRLLGLTPVQLASMSELKLALGDLPLQECPAPGTDQEK